LIEPHVFVAFLTLCMYVSYSKLFQEKKRWGTWKMWLWCL